MGHRKVLVGLGLAAAVVAVATTVVQRREGNLPLPTGRRITPIGEQTEVGSYPVNMVLSPDGRYVVVTNTGFRQQLSVLDATSGRLVSKVDFNPTPDNRQRGLYYGLAWGRGAAGETVLYVSRGVEDKVSMYRLDEGGTLAFVSDLDNPSPNTPIKVPYHVAGLATSADGRTVYAVNNQTHAWSDMRGSVSVIDAAQNKVTRLIRVQGYPLAVAAPTQGPMAGKRLYVSSERDGGVSEVDLESGKVHHLYRTGENPTALLLNRDQTQLFVANSNSDTVSIVDTAKDQITETILLRPPQLERWPGSTPLGMALSPDEKRLYVAMADLNAIAVVDLVPTSRRAFRLIGYIPAGWYPTSVVVSPNGERLFVSNAKGVLPRVANGKPREGIGERSQYIQNILEGTVSTIDLRRATRDLARHTQRVLANNLATGKVYERNQREFKFPSEIKHVIYVIKENRTYDQVLGDLPKGNGDPSLTLFPREVSPNHHALAERFVLFDNFYVCAEVSGDGWNWSTQGIANEYVSRNVPYNYSGRGRDYDFEGTNTGVPVDRRAEGNEPDPDVARSGEQRRVADTHVVNESGGYIWDRIAGKQGLTYRNYGFFLAFGNPRSGPDGKPLAVDGEPTKRTLLGHTSPDFRRYDMAYADSEAWVKHGLPPAPKQLPSFGSQNDPSRMTAWLREYAGYVRDGNMPNFMMVRLGRDHTAGTTPGQSSPRACVADNDYALGQLVEAVSKSPYWNKTAIFVLEDDAQAGFDHVDAHRSLAYVISPYVRQGRVDSRFYNTTSVLRTMGLILGTEPLTQYDAVASPMSVFEARPVNPEPYTAILPPKEIVGEVNAATAYRANDSARLINRFQEESLPDIELNDILWGAIKGAKTPRPKAPNALWSAWEEDEEE